MESLLTHFLGELPADIDAALEENPHSCDLWNAKGCAAYTAKDYAEAKGAFDKAILLSNQYHHYIHYECAATLIARARWHLAGEDWQAARQDLDAAVFQDHGSAAALLMRAWLAARAGDEASARQDIAQAQRYNPKAKDLRLPDDWIGAPRYDRALATDLAWRQSIRLPGYASIPRGVSAHDKGVALLASNPAEAAHILAGQLSHPRAWRHYGMALVASGEREKAKEALDGAAEQHHAWHMAYHRAAATHHLNRAFAHQALGDSLLAWQDAMKAADIDKNWDVAREWRNAFSAEACA